MYKIGIIMVLLAGATWALVGKFTGDSELALYTAAAVFVFGGGLFWMTFKNTVHIPRAAAPAHSPELPQVITALNAKAKELEALKSDFISGVASEVHDPLSKLEASAKLLLEGAYGKVSPAAEEALRQIAAQAAEARMAAKTFVDTHPLALENQEPERSIASIKKLKIG